ncbi:hypothetical protein B0H14DRAFT_3126124 [Mycena olivaceomarginata]|nr:hypothetical protein B0H14DRAFT_3126124 [Mycena olivaceomarginata]
MVHDLHSSLSDRRNGVSDEQKDGKNRSGLPDRGQHLGWLYDEGRTQASLQVVVLLAGNYWSLPEFPPAGGGYLARSVRITGSCSDLGGGEDGKLTRFGGNRNHIRHQGTSGSSDAHFLGSDGSTMSVGEIDCRLTRKRTVTGYRIMPLPVPYGGRTKPQTRRGRNRNYGPVNPSVLLSRPAQALRLEAKKNEIRSTAAVVTKESDMWARTAGGARGRRDASAGAVACARSGVVAKRKRTRRRGTGIAAGAGRATGKATASVCRGGGWARRREGGCGQTADSRVETGCNGRGDTKGTQVRVLRRRGVASWGGTRLRTARCPGADRTAARWMRDRAGGAARRARARTRTRGSVVVRGGDAGAGNGGGAVVTWRVRGAASVGRRRALGETGHAQLWKGTCGVAGTGIGSGAERGEDRPRACERCAGSGKWAEGAVSKGKWGGGLGTAIRDWIWG